MTPNECDQLTRKFEKLAAKLYDRYSRGPEQRGDLWWEDAANEDAAKECGGWDLIDHAYENGN